MADRPGGQPGRRPGRRLASFSSGFDRACALTASPWCSSVWRGSRLVAGAGLRPAHVGAPGAAASSAAADGRVALVHNDAARVVQVSALTWSPKVSSIMVVPVCQIGQAGFRIEVVNERRAPATELDLAHLANRGRSARSGDRAAGAGGFEQRGGVRHVASTR